MAESDAEARVLPSAAAEALMPIDVCLVASSGVQHMRLQLPADATVMDALRACGWLPALGVDEAQLLSDITARRVDGVWAVAVFGRRVGPDERLHPYDRVELLAPVVVDPMLARQRRAEHRRRESGERRWARDRDPRLPRRPAVTSADD
jgi:hypothetical protein